MTSDIIVGRPADLDLISVATEKEFTAAINDAVARTGKWLQTAGSALIAKHAGIPAVDVRKSRAFFKAYKKGDGKKAKVWFGFNPGSLGFFHPRQTKDGVQSRAGFARNAFIPQTFRGAKNPLVLIRDSNSGGLDTSKFSTVFKGFRSRGEDVLKVEGVFDPAVQAAIDAMESEVDNYFTARLRQQLQRWIQQR